ncbi:MULTISPECIES: hypothetical protein [unclassified Nitratiruptor]|uniref:hypothetical protein n=1 Tax=unclassified Nitratiruptor TaxID=2624044 RepID=UPI00191501B4|nr:MULTISPECIES: hypothetical protein [unclassified Nitratiruptor]BCD60870.1 hypothetical protein NitYY0810_C1648 [Nitratiruptor sp. YY08-10]BCD64802.1 hypothetical protein NitYY0814_C1656 [Nitratiruptor sp. YY08-14]
MKKILLSTLAISLFALELPVQYDPFQKASVIIKHAPKKRIKPVKRKIAFSLQAILNDKAFINGRLVPLGGKIFGYKLILIGENYVVLQKGKRRKVVSFRKKDILKMERQ